MAARLGSLVLVTLLLVGCAMAQVTPSPSAVAASSPSAVASAASSSSPVATPNATPAASPSPSATVGSALSWQRMGPIKGTNDYYSDIVGFAAGYVVIGDSSVAFSADGTQWTAVDLPFHHSKDQHGIPLEDQVHSIATDGTTVVIVGGYGHTPCTPGNGGTGGGPECLMSPISWVSTDGTTWRTSYPWRGPATPKPYKQGLEFSTVWSDPTGGWDAALDYIAGESAGAGSILHSADGLTWTALPSSPPTVLKGTSANPPESWGPAAAGPTGIRLVAGTWYVQAGQGADPMTDLFASADGASWTAVSSFPGTGGDIRRIVAPSPDDGGLWMVAGSDASSQPTVWTSPDLATWSVVHLPTGTTQSGGSVRDLDWTSLGLVALGSVSDTPDEAHHATWVGTDPAHWTLLATPNGAGDGPDVAAGGPAGAIGLSAVGDTGTPAPIWALK